MGGTYIIYQQGILGVRESSQKNTIKDKKILRRERKENYLFQIVQAFSA